MVGSRAELCVDDVDQHVVGQRTKGAYWIMSWVAADSGISLAINWGKNT